MITRPNEEVKEKTDIPIPLIVARLPGQPHRAKPRDHLERGVTVERDLLRGKRRRSAPASALSNVSQRRLKISRRVAFPKDA